MLLTFEIFGCARNHGKNFPKLSQASFSGIVHWYQNIYKLISLSLTFEILHAQANAIDSINCCLLITESVGERTLHWTTLITIKFKMCSMPDHLILLSIVQCCPAGLTIQLNFVQQRLLCMVESFSTLEHHPLHQTMESKNQRMPWVKWFVLILGLSSFAR